MINNWEIRIFAGIDPDHQIGTITPQSPMTRDGLRMTLDPHGDCLEASWTGLNVQVSPGRWIQHQDIIEIWTQDNPGDPFVARWSGFLVTVANRYSQTSQPFKALGLKQKTKKHGTGYIWASDSAGAMFDAAMSIMAPAWGFFWDTTNFNGGLILPETTQNYQPSYEMFETWASAGGVVWGVGANREAFAREADTGSMTVTEDAPGTTVTWEPASGVDFVSTVIFLWFDETDTLQSHEVTRLDLLMYGPAQQMVWLDRGANAVNINPTTYTPGPDAGSETVFYDGDLGTYATYYGMPVGGSVPLTLSVTASSTNPVTECTIKVQGQPGGDDGEWVRGAIKLYVDGVLHSTLRAAFSQSGYPTYPVHEATIAFDPPLTAGTEIEIRMERSTLDGEPLMEELWVYEFRLERDVTGLLNGWADFYFRNTDTPASVTAPALLAPKPTLEIIRPDSSTVTIPVEQVEYVISKRKNGITNIKAGRKLDPEQEITQSLIKARDQTSQDRAIRVSRGV